MDNENKVTENKSTEEVVNTEVEQQQIQPPIPVTIVPPNNEIIEQKQKEFFEQYDLVIRKMKEALDLFPKPPGKFMKAWLWFQKHAFTSVLFIVLGIAIGIGIEKFINHNDTIRAINLQRFEFKGDLFDVQPSAIKKYYGEGSKNITSIIPQKLVGDSAAEASPVEVSTKKAK